MRRQRRGHTLLELVVALTLAATVTTLATRMALLAQQTAEHVDNAARNAAELAHGAAALAADLHGAGAADVLVANTTTLEVYAPVIAGVVCDRVSEQSIFLLTTSTITPLDAVHRDNPRAGDRLVWTAGDTAYSGGFSTASDSAARSALLSGATQTAGCTSSPLRGSATSAPWRIDLPTGTSAPATGSAVLVQRRTEWRLYQANTSEWYLGRNEWTGSTWSGVQPVVGPLAPVPTGAHFISAPAGVDLTLRATRLAWRHTLGPTHTTTDSIRHRIALRGAR